MNQLGKLINRIPGLRLLISSLPGSALRMHVESFDTPHDVNKRSQSLPGKLDIKRRSPSILYLYHPISTAYSRTIMLLHASVLTKVHAQRHMLLLCMSTQISALLLLVMARDNENETESKQSIYIITSNNSFLYLLWVLHVKLFILHYYKGNNLCCFPFTDPWHNIFKCGATKIITHRYYKLFEPVHEISNNVVCATSKASDQPAHTRSLIRAFASRLSIL